VDSELAALEKFKADLQAHTDLWGESLDDTIPDYPISNSEELRKQSLGLSRQLGALRPFLERFLRSTQMVHPATGVTWDVLDAATGNDVAQIKGPSLDKLLLALESVLGRLDTYGDDEEVAKVREGTRAEQQSPGQEIFLVHGHNNEAKETVARFFEKLDLNVTILHEKPDSGRTIIEKFEQHSVPIDFAIILLTDDDVGNSKAEQMALNPRARQNVVFEHGYFIGKLGRNRVCALRSEEVEVPSDLSGVLYVPLDAQGAWKAKLAQEISAAGIDIDLNKAIR